MLSLFVTAFLWLAFCLEFRNGNWWRAPGWTARYFRNIKKASGKRTINMGAIYKSLARLSEMSNARPPGRRCRIADVGQPAEWQLSVPILLAQLASLCSRYDAFVNTAKYRRLPPIWRPGLPTQRLDCQPPFRIVDIRHWQNKCFSAVFNDTFL